MLWNIILQIKQSIVINKLQNEKKRICLLEIQNGFYYSYVVVSNNTFLKTLFCRSAHFSSLHAPARNLKSFNTEKWRSHWLFICLFFIQWFLILNFILFFFYFIFKLLFNHYINATMLTMINGRCKIPRKFNRNLI